MFLYSCDSLTSPILEGEAFLVMKSLDVKKLGDLQVYVLHDPSSAIADVEKKITEQYTIYRNNIAQSDEYAINLENQIAELNKRLNMLEGEKQNEINHIEETLDQLNKELEGLKPKKTELETHIDDLVQKNEPIQNELKKLNGERFEIEKRFELPIKTAEIEKENVNKKLQEHIEKIVPLGAKLINDHILARNLKVDLVPKDGKFNYSGYHSKTKFEKTIFESYVELNYTPHRTEWLRNESLKYLKYQWENENKMYRVLISSADRSNDYLVFEKFPKELQDTDIRASFYKMYQDFARKHADLEAASDKLMRKIGVLENERRLLLQKFDYNNDSQIGSLKELVQENISQINTYRSKLDSLATDISQKNNLLSKPREEQVSNLRAEIEKSFNHRRDSIEQQINEIKTKHSKYIAESLSKQWELIRKDSAEKMIADTIAKKIAVTAITDGEGKFNLHTPGGGEFVVYAKATTGAEETIFWFEKINVSRFSKNIIKLSNSNAQQAKSLADLIFGDFAEPK